jgi:hypothetical protein
VSEWEWGDDINLFFGIYLTAGIYLIASINLIAGIHFSLLAFISISLLASHAVQLGQPNPRVITEQ